MTTPVLDVQGLQLSRGRREILRGIDLRGPSRRARRVDGPLGLGQDDGAARDRRPRAARRPHHRGRLHARPRATRTGAAPQGRDGVPVPLPVGTPHGVENVWLAPVHVYGALQSEAQTRARALLEDLGVGHRETALPAELSGGEAQRVAIARALAADPKLLLMDEPTASLDPARRGELGDTLRQLAGTGRSLLLTCHDDDFVRDFASRVLVLADGEVVEQGDPPTVLAAPTHEATREAARPAGQRPRRPRVSGRDEAARPLRR